MASVGKSVDVAQLRQRMAELERSEARYRRFEEVLLRLSRRLEGCAGMPEVGQAMAEESQRYFEHDAFLLCYFNEATRMYHPVYAEDTPIGGVRPIPVQTDPQNPSRMAYQAQLINREIEPEETSFDPFGETDRLSRSLMFVPIRWQDKVIGILSVQSYTPFRYSQADFELLQTFADQCGGTLIRVRAEEALLRSEAIYRSVIENARGVPYERRFAPDRFIFIGKGCREMLGVEPEELTSGRFEGLIQEAVSADAEGSRDYRDCRDAFIRGEIERFQADLRIRTPRGETRWLSDCSIPVREEETGRVIGALGIWQDITGRKKAEDKLRQVQRMESLGQAITSVAHYIKNVLACIDGSSVMVEKAIEQKCYEALPCAWSVFKNGNRKVNALVQDLLILAKERVPDKKPVIPRAMIQSILDLAKDRAREQGIDMTFEHDPRIEEVSADPLAIERCLLNLVTNALDALEISARSGGLQPGRLRVRTRLQEDGSGWSLSVSDNGPGIPEDHLPHVFDPFFSTKGYQGTGLGLAVTRKMALEHGGTIEAQSTPGRGTIFTIFFPNGHA